MLKDLFKETVQNDFPAIEYSLLFCDFLRIIEENTPEWVGLIVADSNDMQWWYKGSSLTDLTGWHMIYNREHKNAKGYLYHNGEIVAYGPNKFFSRIWSLRDE